MKYEDTGYDSMNIAELEAEKKELQGAISNERLWQMGSSDSESIRMHEDNINSLLEELEYVDILIEDLSKHESQQNNLRPLDSLILSATTRAAESSSFVQTPSKEASPER